MRIRGVLGGGTQFFVSFVPANVLLRRLASYAAKGAAVFIAIWLIRLLPSWLQTSVIVLTTGFLAYIGIKRAIVCYRQADVFAQKLMRQGVGMIVAFLVSAAIRLPPGAWQESRGMLSNLIVVGFAIAIVYGTLSIEGKNEAPNPEPTRQA